MENNNSMELDLKAIWYLVKKNIFLIIVLTVVCGVSAFLISRYMIDPQFEASVVLSVNTRDEASIHIATDQLTAARQLANTYAVVLTNDLLLGDIIRELGLSDSIESLRGRISAAPIDNTQVMRISMRDRNPNTAQAVLDIIMSQAEELLITTVRAGSVEIVSPPRINHDPVSPNIGLNSAIGAAAGMFLSLAFIFISKALRNTFVTGEDITHQLGLPVIGVIPSLTIKGQRYG